MSVAARAAVPVAVMTAIFWASAQTFDGPELAWWELTLRKVGHFTVYAILAAAWVWALAPGLGMSRALRAAVTISIAYAITDEWHQTFVDGRHGSPVDVGIDAAGALFVTLLTGRRRRRPPGASFDRP